MFSRSYIILIISVVGCYIHLLLPYSFLLNWTMNLVYISDFGLQIFSRKLMKFFCGLASISTFQ